MKSPPPSPASGCRRRRRDDKSPPPPSTPAKLAPLRPPKSPAKLPLSVDGEIAAALRHLRSADPALAPLLSTFPPPSFPSSPHFHSLARRILQQQLSTKAASSIHSRLLSLCGATYLLPTAILALSSDRLRSIGVSRRKAEYLHDLAGKYASGELSDEAIEGMGDDEEGVMRALTAVKGIGQWSAQMFLMFSLRRPDVLPVGDLALRKAVQMLYGLEGVPAAGEVEALCERWRPYRSVGAWYMWRLIESNAKKNKKKKTKMEEADGAPLLMLEATGHALLRDSQYGNFIYKLRKCIDFS